MPTNPKSPFATSFKSAIKRGTPCSNAVNIIAKINKKSPKQVFESLFKAGLCFRQKFNGQWIYWSCNVNGKSNSSYRNECNTTMWQSFIDWCICSGFCTPEQMSKHAGSQKSFMTFCRKFFGQQFSSSTSSKSNTKSKSSSRKTSPKRRRPSTTTKKRSTSIKSKKRSLSLKSKKRSLSLKNKKRSTSLNSKNRSTTLNSKKRSTPKVKANSTRNSTRKTNSPKRKTSAPRSYKFPTSRRMRKAA